MKEPVVQAWWSAAELAAARVPGLPAAVRGVNKVAIRQDWTSRLGRNGSPLARKRQGRGGGWEYHISLLPLRARETLERRARLARLEVAPPEEVEGKGPLWEAFDRLPQRPKDDANARLRALTLVNDLHRAGMSKRTAVERVASDLGVAPSSIYNWQKLVHGRSTEDWLPLLAPKWKGRTRRSECSPEAWEAFKADYLRLERPPAQSCWRRLEAAALRHGWTLPSDIRSLTRRIEAEVPWAARVYLREGADALRRMYPAQRRDRSMFHALQGVNADGHTLDVWVRWQDGEILRPVATVVQDLYSGKIVGWRIDKSESAAAVRLALYDVFRDFGIPDFAVLDNGRAFASKQITGGQPTRYRFTVKPEETEGVLTALGVKVTWTQPYSGQSKPIERAFRDFCSDIAKHPALAGAYVGNRPGAKPDYPGGAKPADFDVFIRTFAEGVAEHNARLGRRAQVAQGRSFDEVFAESYAASPIRKASPEQLRLAMMAAERVTARRPEGSLHVLGNRYWSEFLSQHAGARLTVRFDPEDLHETVAVYGEDGVYLGEAECLAAAGFKSIDAAREHGRKRRSWLRHVRAAAEIARSMSTDQLVALQAEPADAPPPPEAKVVRVLSRGGAAAALKADPLLEPQSLMDRDEVLRLAVEGLRLVTDDDF